MQMAPVSRAHRSRTRISSSDARGALPPVWAGAVQCDVQPSPILPESAQLAGLTTGPCLVTFLRTYCPRQGPVSAVPTEHAG